MTDQEIDKWVEEHLEFRGNWPENSIEKQNIINGMKHIILKFHELCKEEKSEIPINLTWRDIATIDSLLTEVSNSYAIGNFDYDGERENFYKKVLDEYNRLNNN